MSAREFRVGAGYGRRGLPRRRFPGSPRKLTQAERPHEYIPTDENRFDAAGIRFCVCGLPACNPMHEAPRVTVSLDAATPGPEGGTGDKSEEGA